MSDQPHNQPSAGAGNSWDQQPSEPVQPPTYGSQSSQNYQQPPAGQPQPGPAANQYQSQYQAPGQPQPGYQQAPQPYNPEQAASTLQLNYWLSAFFGIISAAIFYFIEKGKNPVLDQHLKELLNFNLVRTIFHVGLAVIIFIVAIIDPFVLPSILNLVNFAAIIVFLVMGIMAATKGPDLFKQGQPYKFPFNIQLVK